MAGPAAEGRGIRSRDGAVSRPLFILGRPAFVPPATLQGLARLGSCGGYHTVAGFGTVWASHRRRRLHVSLFGRRFASPCRRRGWSRATCRRLCARRATAATYDAAATTTTIRPAFASADASSAYLFTLALAPVCAASLLVPVFRIYLAPRSGGPCRRENCVLFSPPGSPG